MTADPVDVSSCRDLLRPVVDLGSVRRDQSHAGASDSAPAFLLDEIAQEEWERLSPSLTSGPLASFAQRTLLAGYCNAVARAVRAEQILAVEGRYYATTTKRGSVMRRRHPAAQDAERGWTAARHLAKQLGITGGLLGEQPNSGERRSLFK